MKTIGMIKIAASSLVLGAAIAPVNASNYGHEASAFEKVAAQAAQQATKLMEKRRFADAVVKAEAAVSAVPQRAEYRALLGQAYLSAGRFLSAETTLAEAASLDPSNVRVGLNLALAQIGNGHRNLALATLDAYRERLSAADFGLAVGLAGDLAGAVTVLEAAARAPDSDAKIRQNLALTYALSGRWREARIMASQDLSPDQLYARMTEWAAFVSPSSTSEQVASLMHVTPVFDPGQPQRLALVPGSTQQVAAVVPVPVAEPGPAPSFSVEPAPVFEVADASAPRPVPVVVASAPEPEPIPVSAMAWSESNPVIQPVAEVKPAIAPLIRSAPRPIKQAVIPAENSMAGQLSRPFRPVESGTFVVQLGAFSNASRAEVAWRGAVGRTRELAGYGASTARINVNNASLYRLSVAGFTTRAAAGRVCARVKAAGGECFVRAIAGDTPLQWASAKGGTRFASRK